MAIFDGSMITKIEVVEKAVRNDFKSDQRKKETGKPSPVYENKQYLVFTRADQTTFWRPVYERDREDPKFAEAFKAFDESRVAAEQGTVLTELPGITPAEIATLVEVNIKSIEVLANMSLAQAKDLDSGGRFEDLRRFAQAYLANRENLEDALSIKKENEELKEELLKLKGALDAPAKKRTKRQSGGIV